MSIHYDVASDEQPVKFGKTLAYYVMGFVLSVALTLIGFWFAYNHVFAGQSLFFALSIVAILQLIVQCVCFIRLNTHSDSAKWDLISFLFIVFVIAIVVVGTLWIMYNLNYYMVH